jgi:hypothetical protein
MLMRPARSTPHYRTWPEPIPPVRKSSLLEWMLPVLMFGGCGTMLVSALSEKGENAAAVGGALMPGEFYLKDTRKVNLSQF